MSLTCYRKTEWYPVQSTTSRRPLN